MHCYYFSLLISVKKTEIQRGGSQTLVYSDSYLMVSAFHAELGRVQTIGIPMDPKGITSADLETHQAHVIYKLGSRIYDGESGLEA